MAFVHTAHGPGRIVAKETMRGRTRYKVSGAGFEVWLDAVDVREASLGDINEDNSTTLPYNPTPQYPSDMWSHDTTIQPGEQEIDAQERLSPSESIDFDSRSNRSFPGPDPALFAKSAYYDDGYDDAPYTGEGGTSDDFNSPSPGSADFERQFGERQQEHNHHPRDSYKCDICNSHGGQKEAGIKEWWDELGHEKDVPAEIEQIAIPKGMRDRMSHKEIEEYLRNNSVGERQREHHHSSLGAKYATWMLSSAPEGDDSVSRFRRDPAQEINRLGYLWTGGVEQPDMAEYGRLIEADKMLRESAWTDVRRKAQRLRREGRVHVLHRGPGNIYANVEGDNGTYTTMVYKVGDTQSIDKWACSCDWGKWAFQRKVSYVGRLCSHGYASYLELQSDEHKGNPGRFHAPKRTASVVDDFQDYVNDFNNGHVDVDVADNFITMPEHSSKEDPYTHDEVQDVYDWARDNLTEREPRDYKMPYYAAAEDGDRAQVLRTRPNSLTPDLVKVPRGEDPYFVDVEEDERETTGPGQIMTGALVDAFGNPYTPANFWRTADDMTTEDPEKNPAAAASEPEVATPRVPDAAPRKEEETGGGSAAENPMGGFDMGTFNTLAGPVIDGVSQFVGPIGQGIGDAIGNIGSGLMFGANRRYADDNVNPNGYDVPESDLERLRSLSGDDPDFGNTDTQNREKAQLIDELRDEGFDASQIVASYGLGNQGQGQPGGAFLQPGGGSWADRSFSGSGPDPKYWFGTSEDVIDRGDEDIDEVDVTEGSGETNHWDESDRPAQGKNARRYYAGDLHEEPDFFSEDKGRKPEPKDHEYEPDMSREGRHRYFAENMPTGTHDLDLSNIDNQVNPYTGDGGSGSQVDLAMDGFGTVNWKGGARQLWANDGDMRDELLQSVGEEIEGIGQYSQFLDEANELGDDESAGAIQEALDDEVDHVENFTDSLERVGGVNDIVRQFQASGGGALANSGGGGNFGDDDIAGQARKFLAKTAGRVYSLAEQQELVDESHPGGARNKPTEDDLAGTHYV